VGQLQIASPDCLRAYSLRQNFETHAFTVQQFTKLRKEKGEVLFGPFEACYSLWRLKVYPGGFKGAKLS
jgi:hypothetical protein